MRNRGVVLQVYRDRLWYWRLIDDIGIRRAHSTGGYGDRRAARDDARFVRALMAKARLVNE